MKNANDDRLRSDRACAEKAFLSGHAQDAFENITLLSEQGSLRARYLLACYYHMGFDCIKIDPQYRNALCLQAEFNDDPFLLYGYAVWCLKKDQVKRRSQIMKQIFEPLCILAKKDEILAQYLIGKMYMDGDSEEQNYSLAAHWLSGGVEEGFAFAQNALAWLYGEGKGVEQDIAKSIRLYRLAAEQGHANAQVNLGIMYSEGLGVQQSDIEAIAWYQKAADQEYAPALLNLGWHFDHGKGVEHDPLQALSLYQKAAEQGNVTAMFNLVNIYRKGIDTPKDIELAARWYMRAIEQDYSLVTETYEDTVKRFRSMSDDIVIWQQ